MSKYKYSVVMPVYNVEKYLEESILSVINQTIGFKENIQLIIVNDGSKDNSEKIALKYEKMYPKNIVYIKQKNAGVFSARNKGFEYVEGEYVNFMDSDDKWDLNAFKYIGDFIKKHPDEADIVAARIKFFEAKTNYHMLDYKFEKTKVVDILEDYNFAHLHNATTFIKTEVAKNHKFDVRLKYCEDAPYINEMVLEKRKFGVVREAIYNYRKRLDASSAVQNKAISEEWYTNTIEYSYKHMMNVSMNKYNKVIPYIQYVIMYDLQWRLKEVMNKNLSPEIKEQYMKNVKDLLVKIEDYIICEQRSIFTEHKIYCLSLKYGRDITQELYYKKGNLYFNNLLVYRIKNNKTILKIEMINIEKDNLVIEGLLNAIIPIKDFEILLNINKEKKEPIELKEAPKSFDTKTTYTMGDQKIIHHYTFKVKIPLKDLKKINFIFKYKDGTENRLSLRFGRFAGICKKYSYCVKDSYIIRHRKKNILITKKTKKKLLKRELRYLLQLMREKQFKLIFYRLAYFICKLFNKKEIWIVSDSEKIANDNGEDFFKYLQKVDNKKIKTYFAIEKNCDDYKKMKKYGKVLKFGTFRYKLKFLLSSKIISSQANEFVLNPFDKKEKYIRDLYNFKFVFLQHGITKDDLSKWLLKYNKNIKMFVTAAKAEYDSIVNGDYYYTKNEVKLTGFPRYDKLINEKKKQIVILPTHRRNLVEWNVSNKLDRSYNPYFKKSEFYKFYNDLINDKNIIDSLKKNGYKMVFALHPLLRKQISDFELDDNAKDYVDIIKTEIDYQKLFSENSLLVTDYSSVVFDFTYLRKPILYTQFDKKTFYEGQVYDKGYFEYEKDGFGPVCYDYETTVQEIVKFIENDCKLDKKYENRINKFFTYNDKNNCKRVYEEILKI